MIGRRGGSASKDSCCRTGCQWGGFGVLTFAVGGIGPAGGPEAPRLDEEDESLTRATLSGPVGGTETTTKALTWT